MSDLPRMDDTSTLGSGGRRPSAALGVTALILAAVACIMAICVGLVISPSLPERLVSDTSPETGLSMFLTLMQLAWTLLGTLGLLIGIVAAATGRGRVQGIAAVTVSVWGAMLYWIM